MINARISLSPYANQVLNVIKAKFALKDKSEAINKFIEIYGEDFVEKEATDEYLKKSLHICEKHIERYGKDKKMSLKELDRLCGE